MFKILSLAAAALLALAPVSEAASNKPLLTAKGAGLIVDAATILGGRLIITGTANKANQLIIIKGTEFNAISAADRTFSFSVQFQPANCLVSLKRSDGRELPLQISGCGPRGDKGETGARGPQGATGPQGPKGDTGLQGETGLQGPKGDTGLQGETGLQGPRGNTGLPGKTGLQGPKGDIGLQGATGPQGPTGSRGADGAGAGHWGIQEFTLSGPREYELTNIDQNTPLSNFSGMIICTVKGSNSEVDTLTTVWIVSRVNFVSVVEMLSKGTVFPLEPMLTVNPNTGRIVVSAASPSAADRTRYACQLQNLL